jgi:hypothetical protein
MEKIVTVFHDAMLLNLSLLSVLVVKRTFPRVSV